MRPMLRITLTYYRHYISSNLSEFHKDVISEKIFEQPETKIILRIQMPFWQMDWMT